jgi:hypothetical protein
MKRLSILFMLLSVSNIVVFAQTTISSNATVKAKGDISLRGLLTNNSAQADFSEASLNLTGTNQTLNTSSPLSVQDLIIDGSGNGDKTFRGDWTITRNFIFTRGVVVPSGKILYTGATALSGSTASFINGPLSQRGAGVRVFPIGTGNAYMPMSLNNVQDAGAEIKAEAFSSGANLTLPQDLSSIASNRYWQLSSTGGSFNAASTSLYVPGSSVDAASVLVVVQADDANGATAVNIGGGVSGDFVTSFSAVNKPILTIGVAEKVNIQIHDLITPFNTDNINDFLKIINIEYVFSSKVSLLDRWGVVVKEWKDFRNYDDPNNPNSDGFDFSKLSPGNYICVLEYKLTPDAPTEKISQMVTVLK